MALSIARAQGPGLRVVHGEVKQLGAAGDAQLVKNTEQIIFDRMRAEFESLSNFAVGHTTGQVLDDRPPRDRIGVAEFWANGVGITHCEAMFRPRL